MSERRLLNEFQRDFPLVAMPYAALARSTSAGAPECRGALGTSLDEPLHIRAGTRRVYVFNASPWTPASVGRAREVLE